MSRKFVWTETTYDRFIKEGRCQGRGTDYLPWYYVHEASHVSKAFRWRGYKIPRVYHIVSLDHLAMLISLELNPGVREMYEQIACLPLSRTIWIRNHYSIRNHPHRDGIEAAVVTDFTYTDAHGVHYISLTDRDGQVKRNDISKTHIERIYYALSDEACEFHLQKPPLFSWSMVQNCQNLFLYDNRLRLLAPDRDLSEPGVYLSQLFRDTRDPIDALCSKAEDRYHLLPSTGLALFCHLVLDGHISMDIHSRWFTQFPRLDALGHAFPYDLEQYRMRLESGDIQNTPTTAKERDE